MARLIIIQGTPCSGKTTWARSQVAGKTNHVIVSPDEIRHALGDYWIPKREPLVARAEDFLLDLALRMDYVVFSDATNFDEKRVAHLRELAERHDAPVEVKKLYVPFREAVRRDANQDRRHHLGEEAIRQFYERYFPKLLAEDLATPAAPAAPVQSARLVTDAEGETLWMPTADDIDNVKALSLLHYKPSDIALVLEVPDTEMRRHIATPESPVYRAYHQGRLESEQTLRARVNAMAQAGEEWAVRQVEKWDRDRLKEELGFKH